MTQKHTKTPTPTPWHTEHGTLYSQYATIGSVHGKTRNDAENEANAALIVRAVNSHDALVQACEILMNAAEYFRAGNRSGGTMGLISTAIDAAESALRAAKGES